MKEVDAGGAVAKMRFLRCNRAFDGRVSQKAFGFAAVRKGERERTMHCYHCGKVGHMSWLSRKRSFTLPGSKM